jgi:hypothetical protein
MVKSLCIAVALLTSCIPPAYVGPGGTAQGTGSTAPAGGAATADRLLGGMTEPGAVSVTFYRGATFKEMVAAADGQIRRLGATPTGPARGPADARSSSR